MSPRSLWDLAEVAGNARPTHVLRLSPPVTREQLRLRRATRISSKQKFPRQISSGHVLNRVREACFAETFQAQLAGIA